jgi:hypothetical protein
MVLRKCVYRGAFDPLWFLATLNVWLGHAGMITDEFEVIVKDWLATAKHLRFKRPYTELVYRTRDRFQCVLRFRNVNHFRSIFDALFIRGRRTSVRGSDKFTQHR